jgi:hypothetical protein
LSQSSSELTRRVLPSSRIERAVDWLWRFDEATDLDPLFELLAINADKKVA